MKKQKSKTLLASWIVGVVYAIYIVAYSISAAASAALETDAATALGTGLGVALLMPHIVFVILSVIFNIIGWAMNLRWSALVGAILYCVAGLLMPIYIPFVLAQIILSFVGFAKLKVIIENNKALAGNAEIHTIKQ